LLDRGFSIGAHSHDHPLYADLPLPQQLAQTRMSMQLLDARFGVSPKAFAFPHTDSGVEDAFFSAVFSEPLLDVSFGTAGLVSHFHPRNIERVSMERTSARAAQILAWQFARATYFRLRPR
jgi:peptidoglycan/xylan/chitin deacetylase (PgdA/CDA1 family)